MATPSPYIYKPSTALACIGAVTFTAISVFATYKLVGLRAWVHIVFLFGILLEATGLVARAFSTTHLTNVTAFLVAYLTTIIAPSFLAAGCYIVFGRVLWASTPPECLKARKLWIPPRWITPIFVSFDMFSFFIQFLGMCSLGAAYKNGGSVDQSRVDSGLHTLRLGLIVQLMCFALFCVVAVRFLFVSRSWYKKRARIMPQGTRGIRFLLWAVVSASALTTVRSIYRVFEFSDSVKKGPPSYIVSHEWLYWVFDAIPMAVVCTILTLVHPGNILPTLFTKFRLNRRVAALYMRDQAWYKDSRESFYAEGNTVGPGFALPAYGGRAKDASRQVHSAPKMPLPVVTRY